jgi:uncharacterized protein YbjT (DUF2867 family)
MILVTGAAGKTGRAVVKALAAKGADVRALVRSPEHVAPLKALGAADVSIGSFEEGRALDLAVAGTQAIYHICPNVSADEVKFAAAVMTAAHGHGPKRFVFHSVLHPQIEAMPHHWRKMQVEDMLWAAGFDLTILQPTAYMQNILGAWRNLIEDGVFRVPYSAETRLSLVDLDDVAEAAALVLMNESHVSATYELVGTSALTQIEVAAAIGSALGRPARVEPEDFETWDERQRSAGMGDYERKTLGSMFRYYAQHGLIGNSNTLRWLLGRAPNDLASFLRRAAPGV